MDAVLVQAANPIAANPIAPNLIGPNPFGPYPIEAGNSRRQLARNDREAGS